MQRAWLWDPTEDVWGFEAAVAYCNKNPEEDELDGVGNSDDALSQTPPASMIASGKHESCLPEAFDASDKHWKDESAYDKH